jgi:hypothetical protein
MELSSMIRVNPHREDLISALDRTVVNAAALFSEADETLADGHQTAREVLSHFVFWHREYGAIISALVDGRLPRLRVGTFRDMHAEAAQEFKEQSLPLLAWRLIGYQAYLATQLRRLPDWSVNFPLKEGGNFVSVEERLRQIESHIRNHLARLRRAQHRGQNGHNNGRFAPA